MGINIVSLVLVFYSHIYRYAEELYYDLFPPSLNPYFYSHTKSVTLPALSTLSYIYTTYSCKYETIDKYTINYCKEEM